MATSNSTSVNVEGRLTMAMDVWQQLVGESEVGRLLAPHQPMKTVYTTGHMAVVRVAAATGESWVVKVTPYDDDVARENQLNAEYEASLELHDCPLLPVVRAQWLQGCHVFQVSEDAGMSLADLVQQEGWQPMSVNDKVQVIRQIIADVLMGLVCNINRKHCDVKPDNICVSAGGVLAPRSLARLIDQGGSSRDDGCSGSGLETLEFTPEPLLAAPSTIGPGRVYEYPAEALALNSAKADVSALAFSAVHVMLAEGLPELLTRWGGQDRGSVLEERLRFCQGFVAGSSSFDKVQQLIWQLQADCPLLLHLLQCMLQPDPAVRWSAQQLVQHPFIKSLVAQRCIELLHGRAAWQQRIDAMMQQLATIPGVKLATSSSGSNSSNSSNSSAGGCEGSGSSNGWDDAVAGVLIAMATESSAAELQVLSLQESVCSLQQHNADLQQQLLQASHARTADKANLQVLLWQEQQKAQAAVEARDRAEALAAELKLQLAEAARRLQQQQEDQQQQQQQQPQPTQEQQQQQPQQTQEQQQQQQPQQTQQQQEEQEEWHGQRAASPCQQPSEQRILTTAAAADGSNSNNSSSSSSSSTNSSSSNNILDVQCITGLACVVRAAPADGGGDAGSALQPCTPLNQAVVTGRGAVSADHDVAGRSSQAQEPSSAVIMIPGAERSRTPSLGGRCRLRHLLLLSGTVAMTAAAAGAAILSGRGEAACRLGRVTCQRAINRRWARRS